MAEERRKREAEGNGETQEQEEKEEKEEKEPRQAGHSRMTVRQRELFLCFKYLEET